MPTTRQSTLIVKKYDDKNSTDNRKESDDTTDTSSNSSGTPKETAGRAGGAGGGGRGSNYIRPKTGTIQDHLTKKEIKQKLEGYIRLKDLSVLKNMPPFKTWIKYINKQTHKFRTGGLLMKVVYPKYIVLVNPNMDNFSWSVQLDDNYFFIKDPEEQERIQKSVEKKEKVKDKLYELYKGGNLKITKK
jgi:hypothetical protein